MAKGKSSPYDAAISALYSVTRVRRNPNDLWRDISSPLAEHATDQTIALVFGAAVEQSLEIAIATHFVLDEDSCRRMFNDPNDMAPIATFATKISMGYALGIYEKHIRDELKLIKAIRNAFAHSAAEIDFSDDRIAKACNELWLPTKWKSALLVQERKDWTTKERYIESAKVLFLYLEDPDRGIKPKQYVSSHSYDLLRK